MRLATTARLATPVSFAKTRAGVATAAHLAGLLAFNAAIVLSPFRARFFLEERPLPPIFADYVDYIVIYAQVFIAIAFGFWLLSLAFQPRRIDFGPPVIWLPVFAVMVAVFAAVPGSPDEPLALFNAVTLLSFAAFALYVANEVKRVSYVLPGIALMVAIQAVVAVTQVTTQAPFGLTSIGEIDLDPNRPGVSIVWAEDGGRLLRAYGLSDHPNILGGVLAAALLVVLAGMARRHEAAGALLCGVFGIGVATVLLTFSRSAALGLGAGLAVAFLLVLVRKEWRTLALWGAAVLVAVMVTVPFIPPYDSHIEARINPGAQAVGSTEERSISERNAVNENTLEMIQDNPLRGVGAGVLPTAMLAAYPDFEYFYQPAHVVILVVAAETGLIGAVAYAVLTLAPWALLWKVRRRLTPELIGVAGAFMALTVIGLFDYYTWSLMAGRFWFWLVLGLFVVAYRRAERQEADAST